MLVRILPFRSVGCAQRSVFPQPNTEISDRQAVLSSARWTSILTVMAISDPPDFPEEASGGAWGLHVPSQPEQ